MADGGDETGETSIARSTPTTVDYRSGSSMDRSRQFGLPYSGKSFLLPIHILVQ